MQDTNGQWYYPLFMGTSTIKNLDSISIECMQLHSHQPSISDSPTQHIAWLSGAEEGDTEGTFYFPDSDPVVIVEPPDFTGESVSEIIIPPNSIAYFILSEAEYTALPITINSIWQLMYLPKFEPKLPESFIVDDIGNGIISINSGTHEVLNAPMGIANVEDWYSTPESPYVCMRMDFAPSIEEIGSPTKSVLFKDINAANEQHDMNMFYDDGWHQDGTAVNFDGNYFYSDTKAVALTNFSSETITYTPFNQIGLISLEVGVATNPFDPAPPLELFGDVNNDGVVNVLDIAWVINMVLGNAEDLPSADMNQDGAIDMLDIVLLVQEVVNQ